MTALVILRLQSVQRGLQIGENGEEKLGKKVFNISRNALEIPISDLNIANY